MRLPRRHSESPASPVAATNGVARSGLGRTFASLRYGQYRLLWFGMLASYLGMQMNIVARGYLAYDLAGVAIALGIVQLSRGLPQLLLSMVGGVAADRFERRKVLVLTQAATGGLAVINAVLILTDSIEVWHLAALGLFEGMVFAFNMPARQAIIPELVPRESMANAIALNNAGMNMCRVAGPSLAGVCIGLPFIGVGGVFVIIAAMYVVVVLMLLNLRPTPIERPARTPETEGLTSGLRYIGARPLLLTLISMAFIPILLGLPYQTLLPVFARSVLDVGSVGLGVMYTASGAGALVGSLGVAYLAEYPRKTQLQLVMGVGFGLSLAAFALSGSFPLSIALLVLVGFTSQGYMALNSTLIMVNTESHMYGRVMSVYMMSWALMPLSSMPLSAIVDATGAGPAVAGAAALILVFMLYVQMFRPDYRRMRTEAAPLS